jgi:aminopeptidase N
MELQMLNLKVLVCGLAVSSMSLMAVAQSADKPASKQPDSKPGQPGERAPRGGGEGGRGQGMGMVEQLSPEKAKAAWDLEATGVANRLGLNAEQTKSLVKAYEDARTSHQAASEKMRKEQADKMRDAEDRREAAQGMRKAMEDMNKTEREKFTKAVTGAISGEKGTQAATALGAFNPMWDRMVDTVSGFKLEGAKQQNVLNAIETYVGAQTKAMQGGPDSDPQDRREAVQAAREKMNASLKKELSEEQFKKFEESMPMRAMGQGGRGRGPGGGEGGEKPKSDK